jgi:hypothetical protein
VTDHAEDLRPEEADAAVHPVDENGEGIDQPDALLLCYQAKPGSGQPKHVKRSGLHVANQFGVERLDTAKEEDLCVPSSFLE